MFNHFYSRYGLALTMLNNKLETHEKVDSEMLIRELEIGQNHFRFEPLPFEVENDKVKFQYLKKEFFEKNPKSIGEQGEFWEETEKNSVEISYFLSPTIITSNKGAENAWKGVARLIKDLGKNKNIRITNAEAKMSLLPISGKISNGKQSQSNSRSSLFEIACSAITTFTDEKPAMLFGNKAEPVCILPDLELLDLQKFISLFKEMKKKETENLLLGKVKVKETRKKDKNIISFHRPKICNGNFPYSPRQSILGSAGLLGAIGRWAKRANLSKEGTEVLESLKNRPMYIVKYGDASSVMYGEWVIDLAKSDNLCDVVDAFERVEILSEERRDYSSPKFQTFFLFASRFLQFFDEKSLQDFLSIRAEYPKEIEKLFNTFFEKIMKKDEKLVQSARALGAWLNRTAYFAAKNEAEARKKANFFLADARDANSKNEAEALKKDDSDTLRKLKAKLKAKFLAEMESSVFSAKSHHALIAQVITRAGRLSFSDAPPGATLFINEIAAETLELDEAKNLIVAYSRIRSTNESKATLQTEEESPEVEIEDTEENNDETE
jgi:hypothetical protein